MTTNHKKAAQMLKQSLTIGLISFVSATSSLSQAAKLDASCYILNKDGQTVQGVNTKEKYPIASVSKVMTSYWALASRGAFYRYATKIHVLPVLPLESKVVDIHLEGSKDPLFNREQLYFLIAQLNQLGVSKIRSLSFDENFAFMADTDTHDVIEGHFDLNFPGQNTVRAQLERVFHGMNPVFGRRAYNLGLRAYQTTRNKAKDYNDMNMPAKIEASVREIKFLSSDDFEKDAAFQDPTVGGTVKNKVELLIQRSVPLAAILKEMNRSSNNYVANLIFQSLGGASEFQKFVKTEDDLTPAEIEFYNGSGDSLEVGGKKVYNSASCEAVIEIVENLDDKATQNDITMADILAVNGKDAPGERSTVSNMYQSDAFSGALIAKTGTVDPNVTLAGMASTKRGDVYFAYIVGTAGRTARRITNDQRVGRGQIQSNLMKLYANFGQKQIIAYNRADHFIPFDKVSELRTPGPEAMLSPKKP